MKECGDKEQSTTMAIILALVGANKPKYYETVKEKCG
jgi:hypothetical protein